VTCLIALTRFFAQIKAEAEENSFNCDYYFDIPVQLGYRIVGFVHDRDVPGLDINAFVELKPVR